MYVWTGDRYTEDNSLLSASVFTGGFVTDYYELQKQLVTTQNEYRLEVHEFENELSVLDYFELLTVDHPSDIEVGVSPDGRIVAYKPLTLPSSCIDANGEQQLELLLKEDGKYFVGNEGDYIIVEFDIPADDDAGTGPSSPHGLWIEPVRAYKDDGVIIIQIAHGEEWYQIANLYPRAHRFSELVKLSGYLEQLSGTVKLRLYWTAYQRLDKLSLVNSVDIPINIRQCELTQASHSVHGVVTDRLAEVDKQYVKLSPGDTVALRFTVPAIIDSSMKRDFVLVTRGYYTTLSGVGLPKISTGELLILTTELNPMIYPNPSGTPAQIRYSISSSGVVSVGVYNALGELVRSLVDGFQPVGVHTVVWDGLDNNGTVVGSGVYLIRVGNADSNITRKLIVIR